MNPLRDTAAFSLRLPLLLSALVTLVSCGTSVQSGNALPGADPSCTANTAQLAEGDGFQEILCGCQETGGNVVASGTGNSVTCTVPVGTQIFFFYIGTKLKHQIAPTDGLSFATGPVSDPSDTLMVRADSFPLTVAGSFPYTDLYDAGITGTLIAQ